MGRVLSISFQIGIILLSIFITEILKPGLKEKRKNISASYQYNINIIMFKRLPTFPQKEALKIEFPFLLKF